MIRKKIKTRSCLLLLGGAVLLSFSGCRSVAGLFLPVDFHPETIAESKTAVLSGNMRRLDSSLEDLEKQTGQGSQLLYLLESGRLRSLAGEDAASRELYAQADALFEDEMLSATFRVSGTLAQGVSLATNDRALPYRGQIYERILLQTFQSFNFLEEGDLQNARIALNKALRDLRWGTDNLEQLSRCGDRALEDRGIRTGQMPPLMNPAYPAANPERSSDNALVYYLSGLLHQAGGDAERAAIDYRNALAFAPNSEPVNHALHSLDSISEGQARVVVIHESDWVSPKIPFSFSIFLKDRSYTLSFPYYPETPYYNVYPEEFIQIGSYQPRLYPLLNIDAVVRRAHEEALPGIILRQILRMAAKQEIQAEAEEADPLLGLAASIYSILSDSPDLRSWQSLPSVIYVGDTTLPAGSYSVRTGLSDEPFMEIDLSPDAITLIRVITANGKRIKVDSFDLPF